MPRSEGNPKSDNAMELTHNIIHGAGVPEVCYLIFFFPDIFKSSNCEDGLTDVKYPLQSTRVARADKAAPMPEHEKGMGLEKTPASAGKSVGTQQGGRKRTK
jgi:hypothetical protein